MLKNHLTVAFRNFWRNKVFSLINISGLAIGISAALVFYLIVQYEFSFERFHPDGERIYRVVSKIEFPGLTIHNSGVPVPTAQAARREVSGLEGLTHFITVYDSKVTIPLTGNSSPAVFKNQKDIVYADEEYFKIFQYHWLAGSPHTALKDPFQVVLTESRAKTYFAHLNHDDIVGQTVLYDDSLKMTVAGIVQDIREATDFRFKEFISRATIEQTGLKGHWSWEEWGSINSSSQLFVKLAAGTIPGVIEQQLVTIRDKYRGNIDKEPKDGTQHFLQPLDDIHFNQEYDAFDTRQANKSVLTGLMAVAAFLLLLGCINFINLTTAQSAMRAKEIGIRKTVGGRKGQLITQFLSETFLFTILATLLSLALTPGLLKIFKDFIPPGVSIQSIGQPHVWIFLVLLVTGVSLLSGFYPAWVLTGFKPVTVMKNQAHSGTSQTRKALLRKTLTVSQFVITQVLLIATLAFSKQIRYSLNKDLGYQKEAIVNINTEWNIFSNTKDDRRFVLLERLKQIPEIERVSLGGSPPASNNTSTTTMKFKEGDQVMETMVEVKYADPNYFDLYKMKLIAGNNLQESDTTRQFVINETYARMLGFKRPEDAIGHTIERNNPVPIVGVVADFHTKSTHAPIKPLAYSSVMNSSYTLHIALKPGGKEAGSWKKALDETEKIYKALYPEDDFKYTFFDESIARFYTAEQNIIRLLKWAAGLCVFISCLGLLGLVIFITSQRTKEIGVRKVLGASVVQILGLLSKDFVLLVVLAFFISAPIAWWGVNQWLENFAFRVEVGWLIFFMVGLSAVLLALLTISFQSVRAAMANPVESLRTE